MPSSVNSSCPTDRSSACALPAPARVRPVLSLCSSLATPSSWCEAACWATGRTPACCSTTSPWPRCARSSGEGTACACTALPVQSAFSCPTGKNYFGLCLAPYSAKQKLHSASFAYSDMIAQICKLPAAFCLPSSGDSAATPVFTVILNRAGTHGTGWGARGTCPLLPFASPCLLSHECCGPLGRACVQLRALHLRGAACT